MKSLNPKVILIIYLIAIILHPIFYFYNFSAQTLQRIDCTTIFLTMIVATTGVAYLWINGVTRTRWAYLILLIVLDISGLHFTFKHIYDFTLILSYLDVNAGLTTYATLLAFVFVFYPIELLRPNYFNIRRFLVFISPIILLAMLAIAGTCFSPTLNSNIISLQKTLSYLVIMIYPFLTFFFALKIQKEHYKWCMENYSNIKSFRTSWVKYYLWGYICLHLSFTFVYFCYSESAISVQRILFLAFITLTLPFVIRQQNLKLREIDNFNTNSEENLIALNSYTTNYKEKLLAHMESEKPFLDPNFRLMDLCSVLPINRTYMSKLLNNEIGESFYDFAARYRVEHSKKLLENRSDLRISEISAICGFSSPSVFGRTFVKATGNTPKEYRRNKQLQQNIPRNLELR